MIGPTNPKPKFLGNWGVRADGQFPRNVTNIPRILVVGPGPHGLSDFPLGLPGPDGRMNFRGMLLTFLGNCSSALTPQFPRNFP